MYDLGSVERKQDLRKRLRRARAQLDMKAQIAAGEKLAEQVATSLMFLSAKRIAIYLSYKSEIQTRPLIEKALCFSSKRIFVPVIDEHRMYFQRFDHQTVLVPNQFGIDEPERNLIQTISPRFLDIVCLPLVGFDSKLNRLGMGGGYYDKTFAFRKERGRKPFLLGLAHSCQFSEDPIPTEPWDIQLDAVVTEQRWYFANQQQ
ncbi:5-formyltetrahydrofolate cyclo-ligase [Sessilibacter sp. MAH1]